MGYKESSENITVYNDTEAEVICYAEHEHGYLKTVGILLFFVGIICLLLALLFFMSIACSKDHGREKHITEEEQSSTEIEEKTEVDAETGDLNTTKSRHRTHHHSTADKWYYEELHNTNECRIWLNCLVLIGLVLVAIGIGCVLVWYFLNEHAWDDGSGEEYEWLKWLGLILLFIGLVLWIVLVVLICIAKDDHAVFMWNGWARQGGSTAEYSAEIDNGDSSYHKHTRSRTGGKQVPVRTVRNWIWLLISLVLLVVVCGAVCSTAWYTGYQPHAITCLGSSGNQTETVQEAIMIPNPDGCEHEHQYGWMKWLGSGLLGAGVLCLLLALLLFFYVCLIQSHGPCEVTNKGKETHTKESHTKEADGGAESSYSRQSSHSRHSGNWCYGDLADDRDLSNLLLVLVCAGLFLCVCGLGCVVGWYFFNHHEFEGYTETGISETPEAEWMKWLGLALVLLALVLLVVVIVLVAIADDDHQVFMWSGWKQVGGHQEEHEETYYDDDGNKKHRTARRYSGGRQEPDTLYRLCVVVTLLIAFVAVVLGAGLLLFWYLEYQLHDANPATCFMPKQERIDKSEAQWMQFGDSWRVGAPDTNSSDLIVTYTGPADHSGDYAANLGIVTPRSWNSSDVVGDAQKSIDEEKQRAKKEYNDDKNQSENGEDKTEADRLMAEAEGQNLAETTSQTGSKAQFFGGIIKSIVGAFGGDDTEYPSVPPPPPPSTWNENTTKNATIAMVFSPDGSQLITNPADHPVVAKLWTGEDGKPLKPDTFANEKTSTPDNLAKTENIDTITPALQTMFSSNATAAARMSRVQAGAEVMFALKVAGKVTFKLASLSADLGMDMGLTDLTVADGGFAMFSSTITLPGAGMRSLYGGDGTIYEGGKASYHDRNWLTGAIATRPVIVEWLFPEIGMVLVNFEDVDDTSFQDILKNRRPVFAREVFVCDDCKQPTSGLTPGMYTNIAIKKMGVMRELLTWSLNNLDDILGQMDMMPDWMLTLFMIPWMAAMELTGGLLGKMDANVFVNNEGFGFLMRGLPPAIFWAPMTPVVDSLFTKGLTSKMNFGCTWMSQSAVKCFVDAQAPMYVAAVLVQDDRDPLDKMSSFLPTNLAENGDGAEFFGALTDALSALTSSVGWVASRAMDTVNGAVEHAEDGASQVFNQISLFGKELGMIIYKGWKLVESLFSMLANSIVGIFVALYDGVARAKAAVEKGFQWLVEKFGWVVALIMSLFLEVGPEEGMYDPHDLVQLLKHQGRHREALDLSVRLTTLKRDLHQADGKTHLASLYHHKLLEIQDYHQHHTPWNSAKIHFEHVKHYVDAHEDSAKASQSSSQSGEEAANAHFPGGDGDMPDYMKMPTEEELPEAVAEEWHEYRSSESSAMPTAKKVYNSQTPFPTAFKQAAESGSSWTEPEYMSGMPSHLNNNWNE